MLTANKIVTTFLLAVFLCPLVSRAQTLADIQQMVAANNWMAAKEAIDNQLVSNTEGSAAAWLLKARIYYTIAINPEFSGLLVDGVGDAFTAIKIADNSDNKFITSELRKENFGLLTNIYQQFNREGIAFYNAAVERADQTRYRQSLDHFKKAVQVRAFTASRGWVLPVSDTLLWYNTTQAAIYAGAEDDAVLFAKKLVDASIFQSKEHSKNDFIPIYQWLLQYYRQKQDGKALKQYSVSALRFFYKNRWFITIALTAHKQYGSPVELLRLYDSILAQYGPDEAIMYGYITETSNYINAQYKAGKQVAKEWTTRQEYNLDQYNAYYPEMGKGWRLAGQYYYNKAVRLQQQKAPAATIKPTLLKAVVRLQFLADNFSTRFVEDSYREAGLLLLKCFTVLGDKVKLAEYQWITKE